MSTFDDLWCEDCGKSHEGMCRKHGVLHKVQDAVIPSRARLTLPQSLNLKMIKENGSIFTGVFSKKNIPVRSQFGPLDAPVISKTKIDTKPKKATTVWKKKHAVQKALETSALSHSSVSESSEMNQSGSDNNISPIISNIKSDQPIHIKGLHSAGAAAEVAISSIQQQLMSITSQSISQTGAGDSVLLGLQSLQQPLQSTPVNGNHNSLSQFQPSLHDLPNISFSSGAIQLSHENLQSLQQQYQNFSQHDLAAFQQNLNLSESASPNPLTHLGVVDPQTAMLHITPMGPPLEVNNQSGDDSGVVDASHLNVSDSTDLTSDTEMDDTAEVDMSFELKVVTEDGFTEVMDNTDEEHSNWMIFVRPATTVKEQNLIAYQEDGCIFFVSLRPIPPNTELKVWYSKDYSKSIGKGMLADEDVIRHEDGRLQCLACEVRFHEQEEMDNHLCVSKIKGRRKGRPRKYIKPTKTWRAKLERSRIKESQQTVIKSEDSKANGNEIVVTPVKRGRGRPRIKPLVVKQPKTPEIKVIEIQHEIEQEELPASLEVTVELDTTCNTDNNVATETYEDNYEDDFEQSLQVDDDDKDPLYADSRLVITTEEKQKKKRGPKYHREPLPCPHCGERFVAEAPYYVHIYGHTGVKPFVCQHPDCGRGFLSKFKLERHSLIHTSPRSHKCPYCDKSFNRKDHLKNHMITHDPNKKIWKCELCGKEYCYSFSYRTHMAFHRAESGETLSCGICKKSFDTKEQLLFHLKIHTGARAAKNSTEKTHSCFECGKKFFTRKDVKRHMITHTKRKDYLCQFCPQRFGRKDHLTRHLRTSHSGDNQNQTVRVRRNTGDSLTPTKRRERQIFSNVEPTMVPLPMALPTVQQDDLHEQLLNGVNQASQPASQSQTALLQNLQYAMSQLPTRDLQFQAAIFEAAAAAAASGQPQDQQQQQHQQSQVTPVNTIQPPPGMPTIHTSIPVQYQINDKGYVMNTQQPEQTVVRQIQLSPNIDYKQLTQQLQGNMYITTGNPATIQQQPQQPNHQQQQQTQQQQHITQTVQQIPIQIQPQHLQQGHIHQTLIGKIEPVEISRSNNIAIMQQPPEYQLSAQSVAGIAQPVSTSLDQSRPSLVMASAGDSKQGPHSQTYSTLLGYMETLKFLENLPTNNTNAIPVQQLQTLNVDISQAQQAQILPAGTYNAVAASGNNILNINQADLKGVVAISHPHGTLQLTPQELKNVVSLAQNVAPVHQVTYQQQPS